jgi:hypothetical protein
MLMAAYPVKKKQMNPQDDFRTNTFKPNTKLLDEKNHLYGIQKNRHF